MHSNKNPTRFAMIEMNSQSDIYHNLVAIEHATAQAVVAGAEFVITPENAFSFGNHKLASEHFEALQYWCGQLARTYNIHFVAGSLPCPFRPDGTPVPDGKFRQTSLLFAPSGDCVARYDKIHLFKANVTSENSSKTTIYDEGKIFEAGCTPVVADTALGKIGLMICFDLRFAQLAKYLRQQGADILIAPSAFTYDTGKLHWQTLLQARALDAQCFLLGMGQIGTHYLPNGSIRKTWGHSQFINANGQVMPMQTLEANPFLSSKQEVLTPLAKQALAWLNVTGLNADNPINTKVQNLYTPQTVTVHVSDFDPVEQVTFRQSIMLPQSERFGITIPTESI